VHKYWLSFCATIDLLVLVSYLACADNLALLLCVYQVADFGLSKILNVDKSHLSGVRSGTPLYVALEIMRDGKTSKVLRLLHTFEMNSGRIPFTFFHHQKSGKLSTEGEVCRCGSR
jgi:serine/threonine protein kinase